MDDLLFISYDPYSKTSHLIKILQKLFKEFGISVNFDKSILSPSTTCTFLGYDIHVDGTITLTHKRFAKLKAQTKQIIQSYLTNRRFITFSSLQRYLGVLVACYDALPLARIHAFPLYQCLH